MTPESLVKTVEDFLAGSCGAVVMRRGCGGSASDRAMIDVLTGTRDGRLAVVEL